MKAELRHLHSPDAPDLRRYVPSDAADFGLLVQALIGPLEGRGEESFDVVVCAPAWLARDVASAGHRFGHGYLIVSRFDYDVIWRVIEALCDQTEGPDWASVAMRLGRFFRWEFDDYRPYNGP